MARRTHHVVPAPGGGWNVRRGGSKRASAHSAKKADAVSIARTISRMQGTELVIHGRNGRIQSSDSHGHDPCPPRG